MNYYGELKQFLYQNRDTNNQAKNIMAINHLRPITESFKEFFPHTSSALDFRALQIILNDIIINQRKTIVELGCGYSTLILSLFIKMNNLSVSLISVEEDKSWMELVQEKLTKEDIKANTKLYHAPIKKSKTDTSWYDKENILKLGLTSVDLLIVDGPIATLENDIRSQAMPFFESILSSNSMVVLDDVNRKAEFKIMKDWEIAYGYKAIIDTNSAYFIQGDHYNIF